MYVHHLAWDLGFLCVLGGVGGRPHPSKTHREPVPGYASLTFSVLTEQQPKLSIYMYLSHGLADR